MDSIRDKIVEKDDIIEINKQKYRVYTRHVEVEYTLNSTEPELIQRFQDVYAPGSPEPLPVDERILQALKTHT